MIADSSAYSILIVEPNLDLKKPYVFLERKKWQIIRVQDVITATQKLQEQAFDLVFLSCSFTNKKMLNFLESLKQASHTKIIPLILVVDFHQPYSIVPGLVWAERLALLSSQSSQQELSIQLHRLL